MDELRRWYRDGLRERLAALEVERELLAAGDEEAPARLLELSLSLSASGTTYGFAPVSAAATRLLSAPAGELGDAARQLAEELGRTVEAGSREHRGVLLVEPDAALAADIAERLRACGRPVRRAASAREMDAELLDHDFAALVLDVVLPDADGRQVLARLREDPATGTLPVRMLSAPTGAALREECERLGAAGLFVKPQEVDALVAALAVELAADPAVDPADARIDPETRGASRAAIRDRFEFWTAMAGPGRAPLSLAVIELAAPAGAGRPETVAAAAARLGQALAPGLVSRWEGRELVALLEGYDRSGAHARLRQARATSSPRPLAFSAGVIQVAPGMTLEEALHAAARLNDSARRASGDRIESDLARAEVPRRTVLFAEDDPVMAVFVKHLLASEGFEVLHFGNGLEALAAASAAGLSLVVLDVLMPGMDGFQVLERLRARPELDRVPIVMLTTLGSERDVARGLELGADDYIVKPFVPPDFLARIRRLLRRAEEHPAPAAQ